MKLTHDKNGRKLCERCAPHDDEVNHPPGMIFVGWGHGWQPCITCGGSGLAESEVPAARDAVMTLKDVFARCPLGYHAGKIVTHRSTTDAEIIEWLRQMDEAIGKLPEMKS